MARYIFVTGGVVSSLGKGLSSASLAYLLQSRGYKVRLRKLDPYLNKMSQELEAETNLELTYQERKTAKHHELDKVNLELRKIKKPIKTKEREIKEAAKKIDNYKRQQIGFEKKKKDLVTAIDRARLQQDNESQRRVAKLRQELRELYDLIEKDKRNLPKTEDHRNSLEQSSANAENAYRNEEINFNCIPYENSEEFYNLDFCQIGIEKFDPESREEWLGSNNYLNPSFVNSDINDGGEVSQFRPYKPNYDLKSKKKSIAEGRILLQDFINFVQTYPSATVLADQFDIQGFIKAQAAEIAIGAVDHYVRVANNYYLYFNPITEKWIYMVNDFDFVFRNNHPASWGNDSWSSPFRDIAGTFAFPASGKVDWASRELGNVNPILWNIVFAEQVNKDLLYQEVKSILDNNMNWENLRNTLSERNALVESAISGTEAGLADGCELIYNPAAIDADAGASLCDFNDISIKRFIELRKTALNEELTNNGF